MSPRKYSLYRLHNIMWLFDQWDNVLVWSQAHTEWVTGHINRGAVKGMAQLIAKNVVFK